MCIRITTPKVTSLNFCIFPIVLCVQEKKEKKLKGWGIYRIWLHTIHFFPYFIDVYKYVYQPWGYVVDCSAIKRCTVVLWHCGEGIYTYLYQIWDSPKTFSYQTVITWNRNGLGAFCSMAHVFLCTKYGLTTTFISLIQIYTTLSSRCYEPHYGTWNIYGTLIQESITNDFVIYINMYALLCFVDENVDGIFGVVYTYMLTFLHWTWKYSKNICEIGFLPDKTRGWPKIWYQVFYCLIFAFILFYG